MIDYAYDIKQAVTMEQVCEMYGIEVNRAGFACCPFHVEKTGSMKVYPGDRGFHCFGCGQGGSVIDFVMLLFGLPFLDAIRKMNEDFSLGFDIDGELDEQKRREAEERARHRREALRRKQDALRRAQVAYDIALNKFAYLDSKRLRNAPASPQEPISEEYADAVRRLPVAEYELDKAEMELVKIEHEDLSIAFRERI